MTLPELLVVLLVMGILAAIAVPALVGQIESARDSAVESDLAGAKTAQLLYMEDHKETMATDLTALYPYGFKTSDGVTGAQMLVDSAARTFCIQAASASGNWFRVNESSGVARASC